MKVIKKFNLLQDHEYIEAMPLPLRALSLAITSTTTNTNFQNLKNYQIDQQIIHVNSEVNIELIPLK